MVSTFFGAATSMRPLSQRGCASEADEGRSACFVIASSETSALLIRPRFAPETLEQKGLHRVWPSATCGFGCGPYRIRTCDAQIKSLPL
jgi:hypothetical protein